MLDMRRNAHVDHEEQSSMLLGSHHDSAVGPDDDDDEAEVTPSTRLIAADHVGAASNVVRHRPTAASPSPQLGGPSLTGRGPPSTTVKTANTGADDGVDCCCCCCACDASRTCHCRCPPATRRYYFRSHSDDDDDDNESSCSCCQCDVDLNTEWSNKSENTPMFCSYLCQILIDSPHSFSAGKSSHKDHVILLVTPSIAAALSCQVTGTRFTSLFCNNGFLTLAEVPQQHP